jgi:hypothetical protein
LIRGNLDRPAYKSAAIMAVFPIVPALRDMLKVQIFGADLVADAFFYIAFKIPGFYGAYLQK